MTVEIDGKKLETERLSIALRYAVADVVDPFARAALLIAAVALESLSKTEADE